MTPEVDFVLVPVPGHNKKVLVNIGSGENLSEAFNEASSYVAGLARKNKITDVAAGITPKGATHEIVKGTDGHYRLERRRIN